MTIEAQVEQPARPFAWGQLAVGSAIGAIAVWSMALHYTEATPSEMLAGVAETYRAWRDGLLTPLLEFTQIELSSLDRDTLAFDIVMVGAMVRTATRYPSEWGVLLPIVVWVALSPVSYFTFPLIVGPGIWSPSYQAGVTISTIAIYTVLAVAIAPLAGIVGRFMEPTRELDDLTAPPVRYALWNALVISAIAGGLLAVDWSLR